MLNTWLADPMARTVGGLLALVLVSGLTATVVRRTLVRGMRKLAARTTWTWDDVLMDHGTLRQFTRIAPTLIIQFGIGFIPGLPPSLVALIRSLALAGTILFLVLALGAALNAIEEVYRRASNGTRSIKTYVQFLTIAIDIIAAVVIVATLIDRSPLILLSGLGALSAILLLVFKDTILGLVAGVQLTSNDMLRVGDWIEVPAAGADGDVIDIALHTVKVQNWDKTITTIPTHRLISDSFRNWRGMSESGGRRIKRSLLIDLASVRFLDPDQIERLQKLSLLAPYLADKQRELAQWNAGVSAEAPENGRRLTNLGTFRAYAYRYIQAHPGVRADMTRLVRALDPGPQGQPVEIYCFTNTTNWAEHERIKGDIFDHLIATLPSFGLRLYQQPSGGDLQAWLPSEARPDHNADGHATASGEGEHR